MNGDVVADRGPSVLNMVYDSQQRMEGKMDGIVDQVGQNRVDIEKNSGRLYTHEEKLKAIEKHTDDKKVHWNKDIAEEGNLGYAARNKFKIALITTLTTIITIVGGLIIRWVQSLGGP